MASTRDLKLKINSVKNTQQITQAMNLVSASKLQKAKNEMESTRPFFNEIKRAVSNIVKSSKGIKHEFLNVREVHKTVVITITSDRGLCGGYNSSIIKETQLLLKDKKEVELITIGSKGRDFLKNHTKYKITDFTGVSEKPTYEDAAHIGEIVTTMYAQHEADEVYLIYTTFKSTIQHDPVVLKLLPVDVSEFEDDKEKKADALMMYEPNEEVVLNYAIPKYVNTIIYGALTESSASEQAARMTAMDSATENASDIITNYTLMYNRVRQGAITQEITEIVSGANALE